MNVLMIDSPPLFVAGVADVLCKRDVDWHVWSARRPEDVLRLRDALLPGTVEAITIECGEHAARPSWPSVLNETFAGAPWLCVVAAVCRRTIADALLAGAAGIIDRHASADEFADALGRVAAGAIYVPPNDGGATQAPPGGVPAGDDRAFERLTPRQRDVLRLLAEGKSNKQICRVLNVAEGTIKNHLYALFRQIGVSNRTEAALWLARHVPSEPAAFAFAPACSSPG
ncbi:MULTISPECIES: response regulator transcription factor [unclassified Burkholderia]|uniref:helix-turn-helix transcriptional regulator n=1 Tax=unclassified Burkholderia TaxID=2613784 RepID=UPI000F57E1D4|nr:MULTISPECIES: response regulator transcription factor [unclassified Burkholderia]RQR89025.1 DNA-binding response regulator [Burkholderia sp. Bp9011]RQR96519.1 DNA-binding response regulator [Burkholderia sp. Bp8991]RQR98177.1 DNA-binding response regulator [Burkholderia sp. Bp9010]RQS66024.1 DNA-binding response regulator [Burkholderia sp. Bp8977]